MRIKDNSSLQFGTGGFSVWVVNRFSNPLHDGYGALNSKTNPGNPYAGVSLWAGAADPSSQITGSLDLNDVVHSATAGYNNNQWRVLGFHRITGGPVTLRWARSNSTETVIGMQTFPEIDVSASGANAVIGTTLDRRFNKSSVMWPRSSSSKVTRTRRT